MRGECLAVIQGRRRPDLSISDDAFDYVSVADAQRRASQGVLDNMLRIGRMARLVPNFGHGAWAQCCSRADAAHQQPAALYDTANIHFCTIKDFVQLVDAIDATRTADRANTWARRAPACLVVLDLFFFSSAAFRSIAARMGAELAEKRVRFPTDHAQIITFRNRSWVARGPAAGSTDR